MGFERAPLAATKSPDVAPVKARRLPDPGLFEGPRIARKLTVGSTTDPAELEADQIADEVVHRLSAGLAGPGADRPDDELTSGVARRSIATRINRAAATMPAAVEPIGHAGGDVPVDVGARIEAVAGSGHGLEPDVRNRMESAFGLDLGHVRLHTDSEAGRISRQLGARAFTTGGDIFFDHGQYRPESTDGQRLLAHELTHTVQQTGHVSRIHRSVGSPPLPITPHGECRIRRLAYNQKPTTWPAPNTLNRRRSGEGVVGVYFANDGGAVFAPGTVVIKPVASSGEIEYANKFLHEGMGFDVPDTATYDKADAEGQALANVITTPGVVGSKTATEAQDQVDNANKIMVMSIVEGKSLQTLDDAGATEFLQNQAALEQVGKLMVSDAFLGNEDRLIGNKVNLGNFFYAVAGVMHTGKITTIDNDARFLAATKKANGNLDGQMSTKVFYIEQLSSVAGQNMFITMFINRMAASHHADPNTTAEITNNRATIEGHIRTGIVQGLQDIAAVFTTNMDLVRAMADYVDPLVGGNLNVDSAKGTAEHIKATASGTDKDTAADQLSTYVDYRTTRKRFPKGLKWMTRVGMDRGFPK